MKQEVKYCAPQIYATNNWKKYTAYVTQKVCVSSQDHEEKKLKISLYACSYTHWKKNYLKSLPKPDQKKTFSFIYYFDNWNETRAWTQKYQNEHRISLILTVSSNYYNNTINFLTKKSVCVIGKSINFPFSHSTDSGCIFLTIFCTLKILTPYDAETVCSFNKNIYSAFNPFSEFFRYLKDI